MLKRRVFSVIFFLTLFLGYSQNNNGLGLIFEEIPVDNGEIYLNRKIDKIIIVEKLYSNIKLKENTIDITDNNINDYLSDLSFKKEGKKYLYFYISEYTKIGNSAFTDNKTKSQLNQSCFDPPRDFKKIIFEKIEFEEFKACNEIFNNNNSTFYIDFLNSYYGFIISSKKGKNNYKLHCINSECKSQYELVINKENMIYKKIKENLSIFYINETYIIVSDKG
ncbi:hypothetical protein H2O64_15400 [Kordia sp. YSTF-M3]|uniref:Uncharacterized protein n=1 Tax=Kordia aestuariivivens TaxID=2759037 RepID=A0ABR7QBV4_9FLAO|nr:hypothetical protein [Kordia aestuariivivens]MBC8756062.1 hypothetical protein [Kordia aestuariivivens]